MTLPPPLKLRAYTEPACPKGAAVDTLVWSARNARAVYPMKPHHSDLSACVIGGERIIVFQNGYVAETYKSNVPLDGVGLREMAADMAFNAVKGRQA